MSGTAIGGKSPVFTQAYISAPQEQSAISKKDVKSVKLFDSNRDVQKSKSQYENWNGSYVDLLNQYNSIVQDSERYKTTINNSTKNNNKLDTTANTNGKASTVPPSTVEGTTSQIINQQVNPLANIFGNADKTLMNTTQQAVPQAVKVVQAPVIAQVMTSNLFATAPKSDNPKKDIKDAAVVKADDEKNSAQLSYDSAIGELTSVGGKLDEAKGNVYTFQDRYAQAVAQMERKSDTNFFA